MEIVYIATVSGDSRKVVSGGEFKTKEEATRCADSYNMGADYSHMSVFTVQRQIKNS